MYYKDKSFHYGIQLFFSVLNNITFCHRHAERYPIQQSTPIETAQHVVLSLP